MNFNKYHHQLLLLLITFFSSALIWFLFYKNIPKFLGFPATSLETIYANYDGPNYMIIAKCGYNKDCIRQQFSLPLPLEYYPAHLPAFPLLIKIFSLFLTTPKAMLLVCLLGSAFFTLSCYYFFRLFFSEKKSFWLSFLIIFFPARLFILRLIDAPETWFLGSILFSIVFFKKNKFLPSALFGVFAQLLKSPGILLFVAYAFTFLFEYIKSKKINKNYLWYLLIPISALGIFYLYYLQTGDFWAYFNSGDNIHLTPFPYQVFVSNRSWISTIWLEDIIYILIFCFFALKKLWKKYSRDIVFIFPFVFTLATIMVAHRDISRYIAPVYPFVFLAFGNKITKKKNRLLFYLLIPAVLLYAINFVIGNTAPVDNWTPYF